MTNVSYVYSQEKFVMVIKIYSLINSIIVGLNNQGINFHRYSLILPITMFTFKIKLKIKFRYVEPLTPKQ